jgi:hypothetical protein
MRGDFVERHFTEEETRRIFEVAAEADARPQATSSQSGHTLAELRAIAAEVGLDPVAIDRAAAEIIVSDASPRVARSKFSTLIHEDAVIPRCLSNAEMRQLTSQVEQIVGRRGLLSEAGPWVEWRDMKDRLYVGMIRGGRQTRVRVIADNSAESAFGSAIIGAMGLMLIPTTVGGSWLGLTVTCVAIVAAIGLFLGNRRTAGRRDLRELLDILLDVAGR